MATDDEVPEGLRRAIAILEPLVEAGGPSLKEALEGLYQLRSSFRARHGYAPPTRRREAYEAVAAALREMTNCWVRSEVPSEKNLTAADVALAVLAGLRRRPAGRGRAVVSEAEARGRVTA